MKLQSNIWKNRTINLPDASDTLFDNNGVTELDIDQEKAEYLAAHIAGLAIVDDNTLIATREESEIANKEALDANLKAVDDDKLKSDEEIAKKEAIDKIISIKNIKKLKELASSFDKSEWIDLNSVVSLRNYLISKI